jgi:hypothetical protein
MVSVFLPIERPGADAFSRRDPIRRIGFGAAMIRFLVVVQALVLFLVTTSASAADEATPDQLIQQGLDRRRDGRPTEALELFQRAHAAAPSPRTFGQMGLVETSLEHWVDADMHLSVALTNPDDPWIHKNRAFLEQALATSKQHIGDLVISGPSGVEVFVAGRSVGTLPAVPPLHLAEGAVSVSATAAGFQPFDQTIAIRAGTRTPLTVTLSPIPLRPVATTTPIAAAATTTPEIGTTASPGSPPRGRWHTWVGTSLAAIGVGLVAWGAVWIAVDGNDDCGAVRGASCRTAYNTKTPGWILAGVGTAALAASGIVLFTGRRSDSSAVAMGIGPSSFILQAHF